jgi:transposase-like protein
LNTFAAKGELRMRKWQRYTTEFKAEALKRLKGCENIGALARELKVSRGVLYLWRDKQEGRSREKRPGPVVDTPAIAALKKEVVQLKVALADKTLEADFFKGALQSIEERRHKRGSNGEPGSTGTSKK